MFLGFINNVIKINIINLCITWHTSYAQFFNFIYSSWSYSCIEYDQIYKFVQLTSIILEKNKSPIQAVINVILRRLLLNHSMQHLFVWVIVNTSKWIMPMAKYVFITNSRLSQMVSYIYTKTSSRFWIETPQTILLRIK